MRYLLIFMSLLFSGSVVSQSNLGFLLVSGVEDTRIFAQDYLRPGVEAVIYNRSGVWYHTAEVKRPFGFEFSVIGTVSFDLEEHQEFTLNIADYQNIVFRNGDGSRRVANILGNNDPPVEILIGPENIGGDGGTSLILPQGISSSGIRSIPSYFLQGRLGIFKGTEIKVRYLPTRRSDDLEIDILGGAIQHEFTSWLPAPEVFPIAISGMLAYSSMNASYVFTEVDFLSGEGQHIDSQIDYWLVSGIVSTNFPSFNVYDGVGYLMGFAETAMLGAYTILDRVTGESIVSLTDPFSVSHEVSGIKANLGLSLRLGLFVVNAEYNFQEYQTISAGLHIGI